MNKTLFFVIVLGVAFSWVLAPFVVRAHEVYVLDKNEISEALTAPRPDFAEAVREHFSEFERWFFSAAAIVILVFFVSVSRIIEIVFDPMLLRLKRFAPVITQITLGLAVFASGYYGAVFGVEIPMSGVFGGLEGPARWVFMAVGACLTLGIYPRLASVFVFLVFLPLFWQRGFYMLNYGTYLGEALALIFFGGGYALLSVGLRGKPFEFEKTIALHFHKYKFLLLRLAFGASLVYASVYAKYIHGALALATVDKFHLTQYFPFDPVFLVFGAFLVEILIGLFFVLGFEIRFASLFFITFLVLSINFFGESVWPHIVLIGTALAMFTHGYDRYTLTSKISSRSDLEPVL